MSDKIRLSPSPGDLGSLLVDVDSFGILCEVSICMMMGNMGDNIWWTLVHYTARLMHDGCVGNICGCRHSNYS